MTKEEKSEIELEEIDIEEFGQPEKKKPNAKKYIFRIDKTKYSTEKPVVTGSELLAFAGKTSEMFKIYRHDHGSQPKQVMPEEKVDLRDPGLERFTTMPKDTTDGSDDKRI